jgi:alanine racemase
MNQLPAGRQTYAEIDVAALRSNYSYIRGLVRPDVSILTVVKANAYGHGAAICGPTFEKAGAEWLGVATVGEAVELRNAGVNIPILVLAGAGGRDVGTLHKFRLTIALLDAEMARDLAAAASGTQIHVHLKIDTGMGRIGVLPEELPALIDTIRSAGVFAIDGVFSHFGNADDVTGEHCDVQFDRFGRALNTLKSLGVDPPWVHLANSAATLCRHETHFSMVRPGIALYGIVPPGTPAPELKPVMRLVSHILQIRELPAEYPVSYAQTFVTRRPSRIAVLPIGYADGYSRRLSNKAEVLVRGRRVPVVGRVCMDLTMADVTDVEGARAGDEVVLWGRQGDAEITVNEIAEWQDTVPYEVVNQLGKRVPRLIKS